MPVLGDNKNPTKVSNVPNTVDTSIVVTALTPYASDNWYLFNYA
jgi:hypothetical protein